MAGAAFPAVVVLSLLGAATFFVGSASAAWHAQVLIVGGEPRGWSKPSAPNEESYNHWAVRNRFHVGDVLHFKYEKNDSVLVVTRDAYQLCVVEKPTMHFEGGDTRFRLDHSGIYYFISGTAGNCDAGQRMTLRAMVPQQQQQPDAPASAPTDDAMSPGGQDEGGSGSYQPPPGPGAHHRPSPPGYVGGSGSSTPGSGSGAGSGSASRPPPPPAVGANGNKTGAAGSTHKSSSPSLRGHRVLALALVALLLLLLFLPA